MLCSIVGLYCLGLIFNEDPKPVIQPSVLAKIPDSRYTPKRGDTAYAYGYNRKRDRIYEADGATYSFAYEKYWKALQIKDYAGTRDLESRGLVIELPIGTELLVLETEEFPGKDARADCCIVRVMSGPHTGKKLWMALFEVTRLVDNPDFRPKSAKPAVESATESNKKTTKPVAQDLYDLARKREEQRNLLGAKAVYEELIAKFPDHPLSKRALEKIRFYDPEYLERSDRYYKRNAARWLETAERIESAGKPKEALVYYKLIVERAPDSPSVMKAKERIKAIESLDESRDK